MARAPATEPGEEFIVKPFTALALASKVRELLGPTGDAGDAARG